MPELDAPVEYAILNKDSAKKLRQAEAEITAAVSDGKRVVVRNDSDFAVAATLVVESVKRRLHSDNIKVYQANTFDYKRVLAPSNPDEPLAKPKTHHYKLDLAMVLSREPITDIENATLQETPVKASK